MLWEATQDFCSNPGGLLSVAWIGPELPFLGYLEGPFFILLLIASMADVQPEKSAQAGQYLAWGAAEHWSRQQLNSYENRSGGGEDVAQQRAEV